MNIDSIDTKKEEKLMNCLDPETRLCPKFDQKGIAKFQLASLEDMDPIVVDNCTQEHIQ